MLVRSPCLLFQAKMAVVTMTMGGRRWWMAMAMAMAVVMVMMMNISMGPWPGIPTHIALYTTGALYMHIHNQNLRAPAPGGGLTLL